MEIAKRPICLEHYLTIYSTYYLIRSVVKRRGCPYVILCLSAAYQYRGNAKRIPTAFQRRLTPSWHDPIGFSQRLSRRAGPVHRQAMFYLSTARRTAANDTQAQRDWQERVHALATVVAGHRAHPRYH